MLFTVVVPVFAVDHISTEDLEFEEFANDASYMVAPEPWHPFVLVPQNEYLLENAWGTYEEVDGFLYVKNMKRIVFSSLLLFTKTSRCAILLR